MTGKKTAPAAKGARKSAKSAKSARGPAKGGTLAAKLARLGLKSRFDLVLHLPLRYEDETRITPIAELVDGAFAQVEAEITEATIQYRPRRTMIVRVADASGVLVLRFLNFYGSLTRQMVAGKRLRICGDARTGFFGAEMIHPRYREVEAGTALPLSLTPVYPTTAGLGQTPLRKLIINALNSAKAEGQLTDTAPADAAARLQLVPFAGAIEALHFPAPGAAAATLDRQAHPAWQRMKFDELLAQQLSLQSAYRARRLENAPVFKMALGAPRRGAPEAGLGPGMPGEPLQQRLLAALPFGLTGAQQRTLGEIVRDLEAPHPMRRLLQGDVGSGKTIVAALAACRAIDCGYQTAFLAPTEILAEQHSRKLAQWLLPLGVRIAWLSGSLKKRDKEAAAAMMASGEAQLAIGTHALFQESVHFQKLGLAIVDEQHRFGVGQRLALTQKGTHADPVQEPTLAAEPLPIGVGQRLAVSQKGAHTDSVQEPTRAAEPLLLLREGAATKQIPHQLMMSATPIPRTLAMTFYADLDVSVIDELPPGRTPVKTKLAAESRREEVVARIREACSDGRQVYWVCPLIEESETLQLKTAVETHQRLAEQLPGLEVGLVHGRLKAAEKGAAMARFVAGTTDVLVATTVIEVGVDVPNASLMVIEHAERFGLSQLHQLRGRVGRGVDDSACILLYQTPLSENARARLKVMFETTDGFLIAREDLRLRGPGEFLGKLQSGVPLLRFADLEADVELIEQARATAARMLDLQDPLVAAHLARWLGSRESYLMT